MSGQVPTGVVDVYTCYRSLLQKSPIKETILYIRGECIHMVDVYTYIYI